MRIKMFCFCNSLYFPLQKLLTSLTSLTSRILIPLIISILTSTQAWSQNNPLNPPQIAADVQILVLGDSLSAEFGLERGTGWVSLLEKKLNSTQTQNPLPPFTIVNASISGETTAGGRSRLSILLNKLHPKILVIELGANDSLRGLSMESSKANLDSMTQTALNSKVKVLLVGNLAPANYGPSFNNDLKVMYRDLALKNHIPLVPFMLKGVADAPNASTLFQSDMLHPLAQAHPTILGNIWPELNKLLH